MKFVMQNGNNVSKTDLEEFVSTLPKAWVKPFNTIVVYGSRGKALKITHHAKEGILGIHCPIMYKGTSYETLQEVFISLAALNELGHIPDKLSLAKKENYLNQWHDRAKTV